MNTPEIVKALTPPLHPKVKDITMFWGTLLILVTLTFIIQVRNVMDTKPRDVAKEVLLLRDEVLQNRNELLNNRIEIMSLKNKLNKLNGEPEE